MRRGRGAVVEDGDGVGGWGWAGAGRVLCLVDAVRSSEVLGHIYMALGDLAILAIHPLRAWSLCDIASLLHRGERASLRGLGQRRTCQRMEGKDCARLQQWYLVLSFVRFFLSRIPLINLIQPTGRSRRACHREVPHQVGVVPPISTPPVRHLYNQLHLSTTPDPSPPLNLSSPPPTPSSRSDYSTSSHSPHAYYASSASSWQPSPAPNSC